MRRSYSHLFLGGLQLSLVLTSCEKVLSFKRQTYRAIDDKMVIELISSDELEMRSTQANFVCKYSREDGRLRVTVMMLGIPQAVYLKLTDDGLVDPDGVVLYVPERYGVV